MEYVLYLKSNETVTELILYDNAKVSAEKIQDILALAKLKRNLDPHNFYGRGKNKGKVRNGEGKDVTKNSGIKTQV